MYDQLQVAHFRTARSKFGELKLETCGLLSTEVLQGLKTANLISSDNVTEAINSLSRGSSPGVDDMGLDFFFEHIDTLVAPRLSRLFALVLDRGEMRAHHMCMVVAPLTALQEQGLERGSGNVPYRPISVTTILYRILAKCVAQQLNAAIPQLIGYPQTGYYVGRSYDENVRLVRQTAHDINHNRTSDGGIMLMLDNAKAFDHLQHTFMIEVLQAFNLPPD